MIINVKEILKEEEIGQFSPESLKSINEALNNAVNVEFSARTEQLETENAEKFESLVENISKKFDNQVSTVILENVKNNVGKTIDAKFYNIVKSMVNLLESAGIPTTEKTKELQMKLKQSTEKIASQWKEREEIKAELSSAEKEKMIMSQLQGMKPEVVNAALEHFKNKDMIDAQDELEVFINGDFSELTFDDDEKEKEFAGEIDLEQVQDALEELETDKTDKLQSAAFNKKPKYESLGKGLKPQKAGKTPNVTNEALENASNKAIVESKNGENVEDDTQEAMEQINEFGNLGYHFK